MDRCPKCNKYLIQHNANQYYCQKCKKWFSLNDILPENVKANT